jgi:hypothetical protein
MGLVGPGSSLRCDMTKLTDFQIFLHAALEQLFIAGGRQITWHIRGEKESFYYGSTHDSAIEIWLYEDEAECRFGDFHRLCERPDFESTEHLKNYFIEVVRSRLG